MNYLDQLLEYNRKGSLETVNMTDLYNFVDRNKRSMLIVRGMPGTGKSILGSTLEFKTTNTTLRESDFFFGHGHRWKFREEDLGKSYAWCMQKCYATFKNKEKLIVANRFVRAKEIKGYVNLGLSYDYQVIVVHTLGQPDWKSSKGIPAEKITKMAKDFEPYSGECFWNGNES